MAAQEANKRNNNWMPPPWAILAILVLGMNEFMTLLRQPLYLAVILVGFLLAKALWVQLNISGEFQNGALPGIISLSTRFLPTVMNLLKRLADAGAGQPPAAPETHINKLESKSFASGVYSNSSSDASSNITSSESGAEGSSPLRQQPE